MQPLEKNVIVVSDLLPRHAGKCFTGIFKEIKSPLPKKSGLYFSLL
jgi:hypothetical protein